MLIFLFAGLLGYLYLAAKKAAPPPSVNARTKTQPISWQAKQGFLVGQDELSPGYANRGEGSNIILQKQNALMTDRVEADLQDRLSKTFDPQWRMRWLNALHRVRLQQDINAGRAPSGPVNVDRTVLEVNNDGGEASGFTRCQFNYQDRFRRGLARPGAYPNAKRPLDQLDAGDQTSMQTPLNPNGYKSVIYPGDLDHIPVRDLEREYWSEDGRAYNAGYTPTDEPSKLGGIPLFDQIKRWFTGATTAGTGNLPARSNILDDSVN
jgi:hypothetical protein